MDCYRRICSRCYPKKAEHWDHQVEFTGDDYEDLRKLYLACMKFEEFTPFAKTRSLQKIVYVATDASLENGVAGLGAVWCAPGDASPQFRAWKVQVGDKSQIALEELRAVLLAIESTLENNKDDPPDVFMLAIDSVHARSMIDKGAAHTEMGRDLLRKIFEKLDGRRLVMSYVESKKNPADNPSRGKQVHVDCWNNLVQRLEKLSVAAVTKITTRGKDAMKVEMDGAQ
jgi:hypothetical protein